METLKTLIITKEDKETIRRYLRELSESAGFTYELIHSKLIDDLRIPNETFVRGYDFKTYVMVVYLNGSLKHVESKCIQANYQLLCAEENMSLALDTRKRFCLIYHNGIELETINENIKKKRCSRQKILPIILSYTLQEYIGILRMGLTSGKVSFKDLDNDSIYKSLDYEEESVDDMESDAGLDTHSTVSSITATQKEFEMLLGMEKKRNNKKRNKKAEVKEKADGEINPLTSC